MPTRTIYVSRNGNSFQLKLRDSEGHIPGNDNLTTDVGPGDTVVWELDTNSGLASLEYVQLVARTDPSYNPASQNLLVVLPTKANGFTGTVVTPSPGINKFESYKIGFKIPGDPTTYPDDPKLKMST